MEEEEAARGVVACANPAEGGVVLQCWVWSDRLNPRLISDGGIRMESWRAGAGRIHSLLTCVCSSAFFKKLSE